MSLSIKRSELMQAKHIVSKSSPVWQHINDRSGILSVKNSIGICYNRIKIKWARWKQMEAGRGKCYQIFEMLYRFFVSKDSHFSTNWSRTWYHIMQVTYLRKYKQVNMYRLLWKYSGQIDAVRRKYLNVSLMDSSSFVTLLSLFIPIPPGTSSFTPKCPGA